MTKAISPNLDITNISKSALPRALFVAMKEEILGRKYELSISFVTLAEIKKLSVAYKGDPTHTNVLSFPLSETSGEIIICAETAKKECLSFGRGCRQHIKFLVIHGMLHLDGYVHGSRMEVAEKRLMNKFFVNTKNSR